MNFDMMKRDPDRRISTGQGKPSILDLINLLSDALEKWTITPEERKAGGAPPIGGSSDGTKLFTVFSRR